MKPLREQIEELQSKGYSAVLASAKVVHDVILRSRTNRFRDGLGQRWT